MKRRGTAFIYNPVRLQLLDMRLFAAEFGALPPTDPSWPTETAVESLSVLMQRYQIDGGAYWQWANGNDADEFGAVPMH